MLIKTQFKLNKKSGEQNPVGKTVLQVNQNGFSETLLQLSRKVAANKTSKNKVTTKKGLQSEEAAALDDASLQVSPDTTPSGQAGISSDPQPLQYAQSASIVSDAGSSSSEPFKLDKIDTPVDQSAHTANEGGLSNAQMIGLGILGAAVGGGAIAIAVSNNKSSPGTPSAPNTPSTPDTTSPQIQSLSVNGNSITLVYSEPLDPNHLPSASAFAVTSGGVFNPVTHVVANGNTITLTVLNIIGSGSTVSLSYTDPTSNNDANAIQDPSGNDATGFMQGIVADGYIRGAKIYIDQNGDGIAQESEYTGITTNDDGSFFLPNTLPNGAIIAVGGINIDTGLPQTSPLIAPAGSLVINPLTTLIQAVVVNGNTSVSAAARQVAEALGLSGFDLTSYDPLAGNNVQVQKVAAQINSMLILGAAGDHTVSKAIAQSIANSIVSSVQNNQVLDLSDTATITNILTTSGIGSSAISDVITVNAAIQMASAIGDISSIQSTLLATYQDASSAYSDTDTPATTIGLLGTSNSHIVNIASKNTASLSGTTAPDTLVHLQLGAGIDRTVYANAAGKWLYILSASDINAIGQGTQTIEAWTVAPAGNTGAHASLSVLIDTFAPAKPSISMLSPVVSDAGLYNDTTPSFLANLDPGLTLQAMDGSGSYQNLTPDNLGRVTLTLDNYQGNHALAFRTVDVAGNFSALETINYNLDSIAPIISVSVANKILSPVTNGVTTTGNTTLVTFTFDQNPGSAGLGINDLTVNGGTISSLSAVSSSNGKWTQTATFTVASSNANAIANITVDANFLTDTVGNHSQSSTTSIAVRPSISGDASSDTNIINAVVNMITDELGKLPFVADLADLAFYLATHFTVTWTSDTFKVTYNGTSEFGLPLKADLGWEGLSFKAHAEDNLTVSLACSGQISGGTDINGEFYFDTLGASNASCLTLGICADIPNDLTLAGTLGPLTIVAENMADNDATSITNLNTLTDASRPDAYLAATIALWDPSGTDHRLTWSDIQTASENKTLANLVTAIVKTEAALNFHTTAALDTGVNLIDSFIPTFQFDLVARESISIGTSNTVSPLENSSFTSGVSAFILPQSTIDSLNNIAVTVDQPFTYTASIGLENTAIVAEGIPKIALGVLGFADKTLITPALAFVDFLDSPLPWVTETYQAQDVPTPGGWSALNPLAWGAYAANALNEELKEYTSEAANGFIQDFYTSIDMNADNEITPIDIARYVFEVADDLLGFADELLSIFQELIDTAENEPALLAAALTAATARLGSMFGSVFPGAGTTIGGILGGLTGAGASAYVLTHTQELQDFHDQLSTVANNIHNVVNGIEQALSSLQQFADMLRQYDDLVNTLHATVQTGALSLGDYVFTITNDPDANTSTTPIPATASNSSAAAFTQTTNALKNLFGDEVGVNIADQLQNLGIDLPFLSNPYLLANILTGQTVDLVTADLPLPTVNLGFNLDIRGDVKALLAAITGGVSVGALNIVEKFVDFNIDLFGDLHIDPNISFGLDTAGLNHWVQQGMAWDWGALQGISDNFYMSDHITNAVDLPELGIDVGMGISGAISTSTDYMVGALANLTLALEGIGGIDLNDPNADGKVRLSELWNELSQINSPISLALDSLTAEASGDLGVWIDFSKPILTEGMPSALKALLDATSSVLGYMENRYTLNIPFEGQVQLIG